MTGLGRIIIPVAFDRDRAAQAPWFVDSFLYEKVREKAPDLPVMILTNVSDERVAKQIS